MLHKLYKNRFEIFFISQILILFGALVFPQVLFEEILSPILFQINVLAGMLLISKNKKTVFFFISLFVILSLVLGFNLVDEMTSDAPNFVRMASYFLFYVVVTFHIIKQVWKSKRVNKNTIFGLISGYVSLGFIGFFICVSVEMGHPGSFKGLLALGEGSFLERIMYFSYITLLTIGYGDIYPVTLLAQKASILIGLMGQIYTVIITGIIVGKYINQNYVDKGGE